MGEGSSLSTLSLLMRNEDIEPYQRHHGLPSINCQVPAVGAEEEAAVDYLQTAVEHEEGPSSPLPPPSPSSDPVS